MGGRKKQYIPKSFKSTGEARDTFANIYESMLCSAAYQDLTKNQRLLYVYMKAQYYGKRKPGRDNPDIESLQGDDQLDTAYSYRNLAEVYVYQGKYSDAEGLHKKSLQILEGEFGKHHLEIAGSYNNLAKIYSVQGKCAKAEKWYKKSLQIRRELLGEDHPDTVSVYSSNWI